MPSGFNEHFDMGKQQDVHTPGSLDSAAPTDVGNLHPRVEGAEFLVDGQPGKIEYGNAGTDGTAAHVPLGYGNNAPSPERVSGKR